MLLLFRCVFFFFKQKTAYEISECDWSSDVCSSDLSSHKQKTAYEISECDWSSDVCSSDLSSHIQKSRMPSSACNKKDRKSTRLNSSHIQKSRMPYHRSEEHRSELQSHSEISYAVFCLKKKKERVPVIFSEVIPRQLVSLVTDIVFFVISGQTVILIALFFFF